MTITDYRKYLNSPEWRAKATAAKARARWRCGLCYAAAILETHHRTYERVPNEDPEDLIPLCERCHDRHHDAIAFVPRIPFGAELN